MVLEGEIFDGNKTVGEAIGILADRIGSKGLTALCDSGRNVPAMAMPRIQEIYQCVNRYRQLRLIKK